jgi:hypothetical protein
VQVTVDLVVRAIIKYSNINALFLRVYGVWSLCESERGYGNLKEKEREIKRGGGLAAESVR